MNIFKVLFTAAAVSFLAGGVCLAEDLGRGSKAVEEQAVADSGVREVQWLWGEVLSVDTSRKQINVKYLDYETDNEKEIVLSVNSKTSYENISDITELKPQDIVSVDYLSEPGGGNTAVNISVEKLEENRDIPEEAGAQDPQPTGEAGE